MKATDKVGGSLLRIGFLKRFSQNGKIQVFRGLSIITLKEGLRPLLIHYWR